jgi:hypothetical protein
MATTATTTKHESSRKDRVESGRGECWCLGEKRREVCRTAPRQTSTSDAAAVCSPSKGETAQNTPFKFEWALLGLAGQLLLATSDFEPCQYSVPIQIQASYGQEPRPANLKCGASTADQQGSRFRVCQ